MVGLTTVTMFSFFKYFQVEPFMFAQIPSKAIPNEN
jgi:hypothetical protein